MNEAHKFYCGTKISDFRKMEITTCIDNRKNGTDQKDDLTIDVDNILSEVKKTSLNEYCKSLDSIDQTRITGIDPLPNDKCICDMRLSKVQKSICSTDFDLGQFKDQLIAYQIDNFDELNKDSIIAASAIDGSDCNLDQYSYCSEKFKDRSIITQKNKSIELPYNNDSAINKDKALALKRLQNLSKRKESLKDYILKASNGDYSEANVITFSLCMSNDNFPQDIKQLQYDIMITYPSIELSCNSSTEINAKSKIINEIATQIFNGEDFNEKKVTKELQIQQCSNIQSNLEKICSPNLTLKDTLESYNTVKENTLTNSLLGAETASLSCLYNTNKQNSFGLNSTDSRSSVQVSAKEEEKKVIDIIDEMKEIAEEKNLTQEDRSRLKVMEKKIEKDYGIEFDIFKDTKNSIIGQVRTSIYQKEIERRKNEIANLKKEINSSKEMTFSDKQKTREKIKKLSKPITRNDLFNNANTTPYTPNFNTPPSSVAEAKFQFPSYDIDNNGKIIYENSDAFQNEQKVGANNKPIQKNSRDSASLNQNNDNSSGQSITSGGQTIASSPFAIVASYDSIKNYNIPSRLEEREALYDGQDPEVKAVFLQDEKLMRLFRYKEDKYELEEEFDARKFYANINQFDNKTKELGVIFFKRYAVNDLNTILKN